MTSNLTIFAIVIYETSKTILRTSFIKLFECKLKHLSKNVLMNVIQIFLWTLLDYMDKKYVIQEQLNEQLKNGLIKI